MSLKVLNLFKNTLIHFGFAKNFLLLGRLRITSDYKVSWKDIYREMAASDEDWSDWDVTVNNGLDGVDVSDNLLRYFQKLTNLQFSVI